MAQTFLWAGLAGLGLLLSPLAAAEGPAPAPAQLDPASCAGLPIRDALLDRTTVFDHQALIPIGEATAAQLRGLILTGCSADGRFAFVRLDNALVAVRAEALAFAAAQNGDPAIVARPPAPRAPAAEPPSGGAPTEDSLREETIGGLRGIRAPAPSTGGGLSSSAAAVLVSLGPQDLRRARNGGSAVVLLGQGAGAAARNRALCLALEDQLGDASVAEVIAGERVRDGRIERLRPTYWLLAAPLPTQARDICAERIAKFDFDRAGRIRTKYGLTARGPLILVAREDESRAAVLDFGAAPAEDGADLVRYFKEGFSQDADIWSPARHAPTAAAARIAEVLGRSIAGAAISSLITPIARAGCPLGDPLDICAAQ